MSLAGEMPWYYANSGDRQGPVSDDEFAQLIATGRVRDETLVWKQGMPDWRRFSEVAPALGIPPPLPVASSVPDGSPTTGMPSGPIAPAFASHSSGGASEVTGPQYAGFWLRFIAVLIDSIILGIMGQVAGSMVQTMVFPDSISRLAQMRENPEALDPQMITFLLQMMGVMFLVGTVLGIVYDVVFISRYAATPGKLAVGVRIERADGSRLSLGRIIGRYFGRMLSGLVLCVGYLIAAFDDQKRALHDYLCDTRVVKRG